MASYGSKPYAASFDAVMRSRELFRLVVRIAIFDYAGHAFTIHLARSLAERGHTVLYSYFADVQGPKGPLAHRLSDPDTLTIAPVSLGVPFHKYNFLIRFRQERKVGEFFARQILQFKPDVLCSANMPLDAQTKIQGAATRSGAAFVNWLQDIISIAMQTVLSRSAPGIGHLIARHYSAIERDLLLRSDAIIAISEDFYSALSGLALRPEKCHVMPNWAPISELPQQPKDNAWSRAHGLANLKTILYAGTMGLKHNPDIITKLAEMLLTRPQIAIAVISDGIGADYLARQKAKLNLFNLRLLPFQPADAMPMALGSANLLTAMIDADAGIYSVPSKILSYMCAGRPTLLSAPGSNLAARIIASNGLGRTTEPGDVHGFIAAALDLLDDDTMCEAIGASARRYAEKTFDITAIATRFEVICDLACAACRDRAR